MKVKEDIEKAGLKLDIQKTNIMASGPITSWQIDGETMETVRDFIFLGSKITADGDCSHEVKRHLLFGRKAITNPESILKSRDITLPTKGRVVKAVVFPVVMYGYESCTIKKAERRRIDAWNCGVGEDSWVCWTARRSNKSILKEISPEYSLEAEAETPVRWPPDVKNWLIGKDPDARKDWRPEEKGTTEDETVDWHHWLNEHEFEQASSWWWTAKPDLLQSLVLQRVEHDWATEPNWLNWSLKIAVTVEVCVIDT